MTWQPPVIAFLEASLVRPLVLVATAWLSLRILGVRHPASRHAVWTAVLVGMLVLPIVSVAAPHWTLPVLPGTAHVANEPVAPVPPVADPAEAVAGVDSSFAATDTTESVPSAASAWPSSETAIVLVYASGLLAMLAYRLMGWALLRRVVSRSTSLRPVCLRESSDVVTPVAVGVLHRAVILPAGWRQWSTHTKRAVFAHEFAHLHRGDTLVAALARLVTTVFWFHPLAWWVSRKTSDLAELACDAVALQRVGDPAGYSRVLVAFAETVSRSGERVALPGLAIASHSRMSDRVDQVFAMSNGTMRRLRRPAIWITAIGMPALCLAASVAPASRIAQPDGTTPRADVAPATASGSERVPLVAASPVQNPATSASPASDKAAASKVTSQFDVVSIKPCASVDSASTGRGAGPNLAQTSPGHVVLGLCDACVTR